MKQVRASAARQDGRIIPAVGRDWFRIGVGTTEERRSRGLATLGVWGHSQLRDEMLQVRI